MAHKDELAPGTLTAADLREALRVNKSLLSQARGDGNARMRDDRVAAQKVVIAQAQRRIVELEQAFVNAPQRIARLEATIARQERELDAMSIKAPPKPKSQREVEVERRIARLAELQPRIAEGDPTALAEFKKLLMGM